MNWITTLKSLGHITEAIIHFNNGIESFKTGKSTVEVSRSFSDALNKIQTEWGNCESGQAVGEVNLFQTMILKGLGAEGRIDFLQSAELRNFVFFEPQIMDHSTLRRHQYRPDQGIEQELEKKASKKHLKVVNAYKKYSSQQNDEVEESLIEKVAELLYVVRSNIAHGEKTPYGPDLKKKERDEEVCKVVIPLQRLLLNILFDYPERKLVVYGTLARGKVNHSILSDIQGRWEDCEVKGRVDEIDGLPFFYWQPSGPFLKAQLFTSSILPSRWKQIDEFEGSDYRRILIPVARNDGINIANIYVTDHHSEVNKWQH